MSDTKCLTLTLSCPDQRGIVAAVSTFISDHGGWITESNHHTDIDNQHFYMRQEIRADTLSLDAAGFYDLFPQIARGFGMDWKLSDNTQKKRVVIFVSKLEHCLYDLLARWKSNELAIEIPCVISNHNTFRQLVEWHGIPFHHIEIRADNRDQAYETINELCNTEAADVLVLARFMQVLPSWMCRIYEGRIINIHHSFLPAFIGGKPYHQAYARGVKLIGATCHYVTEDLDEGPIIEQDIARIDHSDSVSDLVRYGKDVEKSVLARGLRYHIEDRVITRDNRTVVFR